MNIRVFFRNITYLYKTSINSWDTVRKLFWLYNISAKLGIKNVTKNKFYFKFPTPVGLIKLCVRNNKGSDAFILSEVFEHQHYNIECNINISSQVVIVDLGANAGFTSIYFAKKYKNLKLICVEPMPDNIAILRENLSVNNVNAVIYDSAISTFDGILQMEVSDKDYGHKVHNIQFGRNISDKTITVRSICINTIINENAINAVDILKVDIEGYEGVLFESNNKWLHNVKTIIMEVHENVDITRIVSIVKEYSFDNCTQINGMWVLSK